MALSCRLSDAHLVFASMSYRLTRPTWRSKQAVSPGILQSGTGKVASVWRSRYARSRQEVNDTT